MLKIARFSSKIRKRFKSAKKSLWSLHCEIQPTYHGCTVNLGWHGEATDCLGSRLVITPGRQVPASLLPSAAACVWSSVVISAHLPTEHSLFHAHAYHSRCRCCRTACVEQLTGYYKTDHQPRTISATSRKHIY